MRAKMLWVAAGMLLGAVGLTVLGLAMDWPSQRVFAQTEVEDGNTTDTADPAETFRSIFTTPKLSQELAPSEVVRIDLSFGEITNVSPALTNGVTALGYARRVEYDGASYGQIVLAGVSKDGQTEPLTAADFEVQFPMETTFLPAEPYEIVGDVAALEAALVRLQENTRDTEAEAETEEPIVATSTDEGTSVGTSGDNTEAADYQSPEPITVAEADDPAESHVITSEGCEIVVDLARLTATQQTRVVHTVDGVIQDEGTCADSDESYPLQQSYLVCPDLVDMENRTATAQFVYYYINGGAARVEVTECQPDTEFVYPIVENTDACSLVFDYDALLATPHATLSYTDRNAVEQQVRGCEPSETVEAVPLVETTSICGIVHDYEQGLSVQQVAYTYDYNGTLFQAGGCRDSGTTYPHEQVYEDASGQTVCAPIVDYDTSTVTMRYRVQITVDDVDQYITNCTPDTSTSALVETTDGCANPAFWDHDVPGGISYGESRYYYVSDGETVYVTECDRSGVTYPHQLEAVGWRNFDETRDALPLHTVYIEPPTGRYDVVVGTVVEGALREPYVYVGEETVESGVVEYTGCEAVKETSRVASYTRPDGTLYQEILGAGDPIGPLDVCTSVAQTPVWRPTSKGSIGYVSSYCLSYHTTASSEGSENQVCGGWAANCRVTAQYEGTRVLNREDGQTVTQTSVNRPSASTSFTTSAINGTGIMSNGDNGNCAATGTTAPDPWTGVEQTQWNQAEGW